MNSLDVEIVLKSHSTMARKDIIKMCTHYVSSNNVAPGSMISKFDKVKYLILNDNVDYLVIGELEKRSQYINTSDIHVNWYMYSLDVNGPQSETCQQESGDPINLATHYVLPSLEFFTLWENLVYESGIKEDLLKYAQTMMKFSDAGVNTNIISCNRVILLHGPPGTGKTSLCKALAHKLSIKLQQRFTQAIFVEINAHSLFSKWFSESGKLVTKMFTQIKELVENPKMLVCVLIDEIESLAHAREQCMSGNEPSDSIRVVNAVLTQIDQIKRFSNVIILTTSNMTGAIDLAFVDRADVKQYLGLPGIQTIYQIYHSCIEELRKTGIVCEMENLEDVGLFKSLGGDDDENGLGKRTKKLIRLCEKSKGLSGRTLRRVPFLAHALFGKGDASTLDAFLCAMDEAIDHEWQQQKLLVNQI